MQNYLTQVWNWCENYLQSYHKTKKGILIQRQYRLWIILWDAYMNSKSFTTAQRFWRWDSYVENWILFKSAEWLPDLTINFLLFQITPTLTIPKKEIFQINFKNFKEQNYLSDLKKQTGRLCFLIYHIKSF